MKRIAIDIDEVLMPFVRPMARWKGVKMPRHDTKYEYVYKDMFKITEEESAEMVREFYKSREFSEIKPIPGSQLGMVKLRGKFDKVYAVTGRQDIVRDKTEAWLSQHFEGVFDDVVLTNSYTDFEVSKLDICRSLAIGTIIDDNMHTCLQCKEAGMDARNFMGYEYVYQWCDHTDMSMYGWKEYKRNTTK
jgi:5'(3')-deoxyribonucleotidase